jgi:hypothetical protein
MNNTLIAQIQRFTLDARNNLEREASEQLEGLYGWLPDGSFNKVELYPALNQIEEARETRRRLEAYTSDEKEAGLDAKAARQKLIRETAFTWLNRFVALRMMEERRLMKPVVSRLVESNAYFFWLADEKDPEARKLHDQGETPVNAMGEGPRHTAYRRFLLYQCGELAREVSVLFDPETLASRLCPRPNLLKTLVAAMNAETLAEAWNPGNEETIGWIYQAFNAEEKAAVFEGFGKGEKVTPEQIPPATQIFTPRWVVRFLVENSLGRLWVAMHPDSRLKEMLAYLLPLPSEVRRHLKPVKEITFLDPACGSMHFGLVAFDLFAEMYREELENAGKPGWPEKPSVENLDDIPAAIIEHNLHGIDLDLRAVQLSALTLFLRARTMNPMCTFTDRNLACANIEQITGGRLEEFIRRARFSHPIYERILRALAARLKDSDNLGSLLRPEVELERLIAEERRKAKVDSQLVLDFPGLTREQFDTPAGLEEFFDILQEQILRHLDAFVRQSRATGQDPSHFAAEAAKGMRFLGLVQHRYDIVATNPPYIDSRDYNATHKAFLEREFPEAKRNLFSAFIARNLELVDNQGFVAMITGQSFMFISSFETFRLKVLSEAAIETLAQYDYHLFAERVDTTSFVLRREPDAKKREESVGVYFRLVRERDADAKRAAFESALAALQASQPHPLVFHYRQKDFDAIPGKPWVYWMPKRLTKLFEKLNLIEQVAKPRVGLQTGDNDRFLRKWWEVGEKKIGFNFSDCEHAKKSGKKWFPYMKGGTPSPWFGNQENVVDWFDDGAPIRCFGEEEGYIRSRPQNTDYYFRRGVTWSLISSKGFAARLSPGGFIFDVAGMTCFPPGELTELILALLNSRPAKIILSALNPTINYQVGDIERLPVPTERSDKIASLVNECVELAKQHSRESEITYDFIQPLQSIETLSSRKANLAEREVEIDCEVSRLYGLTDEDMAIIDRELTGVTVSTEEDADTETPGEDEDETAANGMSPEAWAQSWISYAVGIVLGRFEVGVPGGLGCGDFSPEVVSALKALVVPDGILVNDPGQPLDLAARVWQALEIMLGGSEARTRVNTALGDGDPLELLQDWFDRFTGSPGNSIWKYHVQLYRKRPVYWPLQSPKRQYTVWVFHERFTRDTLFQIRNDIVEPRLRLAERGISDLRARAESDRRARKELDRQLDFADDLREFSNRLKAIADRGYTPHIDDGVLLNAAPLFEILPSWPEAKKAWQELEAGDYDWAQQTMEYWPERVKEKCNSNRSYAIAHGLEDLCFEPEAAGELAASKRRARR